MKINSISNINKIYTSKPRFCANVPSYHKDRFEKIQFELDGKYGYLVKNVNLKDSSNQDVKAFILQDSTNLNKYYLGIDDSMLAWMQIEDSGDSIYLDRLYAHLGKYDYKGAGSELLKVAIQKSKDLGYNGRVKVCMAGSLPFYRKSNFKFYNTGHDYIANALFDYVTRSKKPIDIAWGDRIRPLAQLDEHGAEALLNNQKLYPKNTAATVEKDVEFSIPNSSGITKIRGDFDFCSPEDDKFVAQFIKKHKNDSVSQMAYLGLVEVDLPENKKALKVDEFSVKPVNFVDSNTQANLNEILYSKLYKIAKQKAQELGYEIIG